MLDVHTNALQAQARTAFHRDLEVRLLALSARLKLPEAFVLESAALYRSCGRELFEFTPARNEVREFQQDSVDMDNLPNNERIVRLAAERRLDNLTNALTGRLSAFTDMPDQVLHHNKPLLAVLNMIAERHQINNPQRIERMAEVIKVAHHWYQRLATDETGYAAFAARTRQLVVGTLVGIGHGGYQLDKNAFDLVVIDEAARATFSELAIAMQSAKRVLLVGDYNQLAPSYDVAHVRQVARDLGLNEVDVKRTDFERAYVLNDGHMLLKQYRMAPAIGDIISHCFYDGTLATGRPSAPEWMSSCPPRGIARCLGSIPLTVSCKKRISARELPMKLKLTCCAACCGNWSTMSRRWGSYVSGMTTILRQPSGLLPVTASRWNSCRCGWNLNLGQRRSAQ